MIATNQFLIVNSRTSSHAGAIGSHWPAFAPDQLGALLTLRHEAVLGRAGERLSVFADCFARASINLALFDEAALGGTDKRLSVFGDRHAFATSRHRRPSSKKRNQKRENNPFHFSFPYLQRGRISKHDASPASGTATHSMRAKSGTAFQPIIGWLVAYIGNLFAPKMILPRLVARPRRGQRRPSTPLPLSSTFNDAATRSSAIPAASPVLKGSPACDQSRKEREWASVG
jgi:hypothetical protein